MYMATCDICGKRAKRHAKQVDRCQECRKSLAEVKGRGRTRLAVRLRDKNRCRDCKRKWTGGERQFDIHHINGECGNRSRNYDRMSDLSSLITLCHRCHYHRHDFAGMGRNGRTRIFDRSLAMKLRKQGMTYDEIARKLGVKYAAIWNGINQHP